MHFPALLQDLAVILGVAAIVTFIFKLIRQPDVFGYVIAAVIVGPHTPAVFSIKDTVNIKILAELGVIFLMFSLGLEFSFRRLAKVGVSAVVTACIQMGAMMTLGLISAHLLDWGRMDAIFLGCMLAISSTTIIIKALEELKLKTTRFAELVFGILIVQDLVAILMLVSLTNTVTTAQFGASDLMMSALKLAVVVAAWFLVGMFVVPRFIRSVAKHGNDEMLTVVAIGLCLSLVALAARFNYSVALGAFIMGSILAESSEVKRIEHMVEPLKNIFGAVFFVSVGMLFDPHVLVTQWSTILIVSLVVIFGQMIFLTIGAFITGQTLKTAIQTAFTMTQIGEFSFIIASLGLAYGAISHSLYPIVVSVSVITTFTTPYLIRMSGPVADAVNHRIPLRAKEIMDNYCAWIQRRTISNDGQKLLVNGVIKLLLNAVVVVTIFTLSANYLIPVLDEYFQAASTAVGGAWAFAFALSAPSLWAMMNAFVDFYAHSKQNRQVSKGRARLVTSIFTVALLGGVSFEYFPTLEILGVTFTLCGVFLMLFRRQVGVYYRWLEFQFESGFQADLGGRVKTGIHARLAPWDARLIEVKVPPGSRIVGKTLIELELREKYGLNVVVISREGQDVVAPKATEFIYPSDILLCFATDLEVERFKFDIESGHIGIDVLSKPEDYGLRRFRISRSSPLNQSTIKNSEIREKFDCISVGIERVQERIRSPMSNTVLLEGDVLWVVGNSLMLNELATLVERESSPPVVTIQPVKL